MKEDTAQLVARTAERLGFSNVALDENGACTLDFGDTFLSVGISADGGLIRLAVPVAEVADPCPRAVLERLLDAQFFFKETRGCTFSYQKETGAVLLHLAIQAMVLDAASFETVINNMLFVARRFSGEIAAILSDQGVSGGSDIPSPEAFSVQDMMGGIMI